jgi:hypothetical protein
MGKVGVVLLSLVVSALPSRAIIPDTCPIPQHETCPPYSSDPAGAQSCQARNNNEDARYWQCEEEYNRARKEEQQRQQKEQHDKYCQQHPDAADCK